MKKSSFVDFFFFFVIKATRNMFPGLGLKYGTPLASSFSFFFFFMDETLLVDAATGGVF